ncbi:glycosyltransferase family 39 protein [Haloarcula hispanica]|uniref:glycosyltransferase family 39 protein n=1 Tax=Haloarcula hispanica TaxID=51589 RepID=UPI0013EB4684|nr:glycosyltransferase family 39 protein [Haloarcula hispanica]MCJ0619397.1 glycosyltransferase family 39 protein [Haloarcula hispanica]
MGIQEHAAVEVAGFFQSLSIIKDGFASYTYLSIFESSSGLHLHSLISSLFLFAGVSEAGRLVALIAGSGSSVLLYIFIKDWFSTKTGILAGSLVWIHPLFIRFSSRWYPESLGILMTLAVMHAVIKDIDEEGRRYYFLAICLLSLAITNHLWEASIALPAAVAYYQAKKIRRSATIIGTTIVVIIIVELIKSYQPSVTSHFQTRSVFYHPEVLLTPNWVFHWAWGGNLFPTDIFSASIIWTIPVAITLIILLTIWGWKNQDDRAVTIIAWFISGLLVMILLPVGWRGHVYYAWGLLVPSALAAAIIITEFLSSKLKVHQTQAVALAILLLSSGIAGSTLYPENPAHIYDDGPLSSEKVTQAGHELRKLPNKDTARIAFRGQLKNDTGRMRIIQSRILMHARINIEAITPAQSEKIIIDEQDICDYKVYISDDDLIVSNC